MEGRGITKDSACLRLHSYHEWMNEWISLMNDDDDDDDDGGDGDDDDDDDVYIHTYTHV